MPPALLDLNDSNLQLWHAGHHLQSPGYALLEGRDYRFGNEARGAARLRPRDINTRYWWQLSTEPLQPALGPARHTADLVHAHLLDLHRAAGEPEELLLAASGSMHRDQLGLLLGIIQQCPFDAVGLVNRSVALGSLHGARGRLFHLELQLHQALLTELSASGGELKLQRSVPLPGCGLLQLQERLVEVVAAGFIRQTRFDPRRKAATEQQLYDALPEALRTLQGATEANIEVNGYRSRVNGRELQAAGQRLFDSARQAMGSRQNNDHIIADPLVGLLPGLGQQLEGVDILAPDLLPEAAAAHSELLLRRGEALSFVSALPCAPGPQLSQAEIAPEPLTAAPSPQPTHLLRGTVALPLATDRAFQHSGGGWQLTGDLAGVSINGEPARAGQWVSCGDRVVVPNEEQALLIEVKP